MNKIEIWISLKFFKEYEKKKKTYLNYSKINTLFKNQLKIKSNLCYN